MYLVFHSPLLYFSWPYCHGFTLFFIYYKYKLNFFLLGFVFVYFFGDHTLCPSMRTDQISSTALNDAGTVISGLIGPVPLFEIYSLFTPRLNWHLRAHQWSSMIISRVQLFFLNSKPFTDTSAILNKLDLRSIVGCPGGHEHNPFGI